MAHQQRGCLRRTTQDLRSIGHTQCLQLLLQPKGFKTVVLVHLCHGLLPMGMSQDRCNMSDRPRHLLVNTLPCRCMDSLPGLVLRRICNKYHLRCNSSFNTGFQGCPRRKT